MDVMWSTSVFKINETFKMQGYEFFGKDFFDIVEVSYIFKHIISTMGDNKK